MIFIKRPPTGGTGKLFLSNNVHALTSYILGNFDRIGMQAKNTKPLTRPCYESIPSAWKSGTNSSINDTYCFPVTTKTIKRIDASWRHVAKMSLGPFLLFFQFKMTQAGTQVVLLEIQINLEGLCCLFFTFNNCFLMQKLA